LEGEKRTVGQILDEMEPSKSKGKLYQVDLKPSEDEYLLWDKPLSEQSEKVRKALEGLEGHGAWTPEAQAWATKEFPSLFEGDFDASVLSDGQKSMVAQAYQDETGRSPFAGKPREMTGEGLYGDLAVSNRSGRDAALSLLSLGIRGIKYLDGSSRGKGEGDYNYVIFDDADVEIEAKFSRKQEERKVPDGERSIFIGKDDAGKPIHLKSSHPSLKERSSVGLWFSKYFASRGNLTQEAFADRIEMDGMKNSEEIEVAGLAMSVRRTAKKEYGKRYAKLNAAQKKAMNDRLQGEDVDLPGDLNDAIDAMRVHLDGLSGRLQDMMTDNIKYRLKMLSADKQEEALVLISRYMGGDKTDEIMAELLAVDPYIAGKIRTHKTIEGNKGHYLNRSYQAFDDPQWRDKVRNDVAVMSAAREYFSSQIAESEGLEGDALESRVEGTISNMLDAAIEKRDMLSFLSSAQLGQKNLGVLKKRKELDPAVMNLLGVYGDPLLNYARSATKMSWLTANHQFLKSINEQGLGVYLSTHATERMSSEIRPFDPETMSPISGLYATPEFAEAIKEATDPESVSDAIKFLRKANGWIKFGKVAVAPTTQVRNFISAGMGVVMNGHFNLKHSVRSALITWSDLKKTGKDKDYVRKMVKYGVLHSSVRAGELTTYMDDLMKDGNWDTGWRSNLKSTGDFFATLYQAGDDFWKIIAFENEKTSIKRWYKLDDVEAEKMAADRIRNGYMTYSHVPKLIRHLRRSPLVGAFVSFPAEVIRTTKNQFVIMSEDAKAGHLVPVARRMIGMTMAMSLVEILAEQSMDALGLDDDDDDAMRALSAPWQQNSRFYYSRDDEGNLRKLDLSYIDLYGTLKKPFYAVLNGNNEDASDKLADAITEVVSPFIGWEISTGAALEIIANKRMGNGSPIYNETDAPEKQLSDISYHLWKAAAPGVWTNIERTWKAVNDDVSRSGKKYTLSDEAKALGGFRWDSVDVRTSLSYKVGEFKRKRSDAHQILSYVLKGQNKVSDTELKDAYLRMVKARNETFSGMSKLINAARKLELDDRQITHLLRSNQINAIDARALMDGKESRYRLTKQKRKTLLKSALGGVSSQVERSMIINRVNDRFNLLSRIMRE